MSEHPHYLYVSRKPEEDYRAHAAYDSGGVSHGVTVYGRRDGRLPRYVQIQVESDGVHVALSLPPAIARMLAGVMVDAAGVADGLPA